MKRRDLLRYSGAIATGGLAIGAAAAAGLSTASNALTRPSRRRIRVAFALSRGATVIDFAGPWEVFQDVMIDGRMPFETYTVASSESLIEATGGLTIKPNYAIAEAPAADVVVIPAMSTDATLNAWIAAQADGAEMIMSVCTGAFQLARTGLLDGLQATTHHDFIDQFARSFPSIRVARDLRYVEHEHLATAAGLTSGIDLALRVVARFFDASVAERTARYMEYQGEGWRLD